MCKNRLPLSLQLFAEDPAPVSGNSGSDNPAPAKTFSQEDVNAIVARESKAAVEKLLKEVGIAPEGDYKAAMKAFKQWQDSQKSELEKATGALSAVEKAKAEAEAKVSALERQIAAISKGIPADKADKYIKLAEAYVNEKTDFAAALELALKDFPIPEKGVAGSGANPAPKKGNDKKPYAPKGAVIL